MQVQDRHQSLSDNDYRADHDYRWEHTSEFVMLARTKATGYYLSNNGEK